MALKAAADLALQRLQAAMRPALSALSAEVLRLRLEDARGGGVAAAELERAEAKLRAKEALEAPLVALLERLALADADAVAGALADAGLRSIAAVAAAAPLPAAIPAASAEALTCWDWPSWTTNACWLGSTVSPQ